MDIFAVFFIFLSGLAALLSLVFFLELIFAWLGQYVLKQNTFPITDLSRTAKAVILIPAHNEETVLAATLESILPQLQHDDELVVIVDNCSDNTKAIAQQFPVTVIERHDEHKRGKGYALDAGVQYCQSKHFDVVVMIDADCIAGSDCRDRLVEAALLKQRPVQCLYLMQNKQDKLSFSQKMSEFTWLIKNKLRPLGLRWLNGPCQLMGAGMAFPASQLYQMEVASGCIVEDMKLGLDFGLKGHAPYFLPEAQVLSHFPTGNHVAAGQKSRWVHGHMEMIRFYVPKLFKRFFQTGCMNTLMLCLDLMVPPVVLLFLINVVLLFASLVLLALGMGQLYYLPLLSIVLMVFTVLFAWLCGGRDIISLKDLVLGVFERVRSLKLYASFFGQSRLKGWNKTSRKE